MNELTNESAELVERLRNQVNALAEYAARLDAGINDEMPRVGATQATAALALDALTRLCEVSSPGRFSTWVDDRIAAAHIAESLCTARGPYRNGDAEVWLDHHTARRGYETLAYFAAHDLDNDRDATRRAGLELADLLELGDEVRTLFLAAAEATDA